MITTLKSRGYDSTGDGGNGRGDGRGDGDGYRHGYGHGNGYGYGNGDGHGNGDGNGDNYETQSAAFPDYLRTCSDPLTALTLL